MVAEFFRSWKSPYTSLCMTGSKLPASLAAVRELLVEGGSFSEMVWALFGLKWLCSQLGDLLYWVWMHIKQEKCPNLQRDPWSSHSSLEASELSYVVVMALCASLQRFCWVCRRAGCSCFKNWGILKFTKYLSTLSLKHEFLLNSCSLFVTQVDWRNRILESWLCQDLFFSVKWGAQKHDEWHLFLLLNMPWSLTFEQLWCLFPLKSLSAKDKDIAK